MCRFIEALRIEDGRIYDVLLHNARLNRTLAENGVHLPSPVRLEAFIHPEGHRERTKCHVDYGMEGVEGITYAPYRPRLVRSLALVDGGAVDYRFKYADRSRLDALFAERGRADDVLIVRNGFLTDTTIANVALYDGCQWVTPAHPLLEGTKRRRLLAQGILVEKDIPVAGIFAYRKICTLNAMLDFREMEFDISPATIIQLQP